VQPAPPRPPTSTPPDRSLIRSLNAVLDRPRPCEVLPGRLAERLEPIRGGNQQRALGQQLGLIGERGEVALTVGNRGLLPGVSSDRCLEVSVAGRHERRVRQPEDMADLVRNESRTWPTRDQAVAKSGRAPNRDRVADKAGADGRKRAGL
jgi:hypothetical protein